MFLLRAHLFFNCKSNVSSTANPTFSAATATAMGLSAAHLSSVQIGGGGEAEGGNGEKGRDGEGGGEGEDSLGFSPLVDPTVTSDIF